MRRVTLPIQILVLGGIIAVLASSAYAQVRTSPSYQIQSDSLNLGGGLGTSSNHILESTVGEVATGPATSSSYNLYAGYQQMQQVYLSLSAAASVVMTPLLGGVSGGESDGQTEVLAVTDGTAGYQLTLTAATEPAMQSGGNSVADYEPAGAAADTNFITGASDSHFAYSISGPDTGSRFLVNAGVCGSGSPSTTACWDGLATTSQVIAERASPNHPAGSTTTIHFKVGIGASALQVAGVYSATATITMLPL